MISVIICAHNPRKEFIDKTLVHLQQQTLPRDDWELLVIDNCSERPLVEQLDLAWHPRGKVIREEKIGLTNARVCGIANAAEELIVFVDDDNLLAADYLEEAIRISRSHSMLGAWGGQQVPEFVTPPADDVRETFMDTLACRTVGRSCWTNMPHCLDATPHGAGMCIRKTVAERYAASLATDSLRRSLGRTGTALLGCEDHDMAITSCDVGLGIGVFPSLILHHIMPPERLRVEYLLRLVEGNGFSAVILGYCRNPSEFVRLPRTVAERIWFWLRTRHLPALRRKRLAAEIRGKRRALEFLKRHEAGAAGSTGPTPLA